MARVAHRRHHRWTNTSSPSTSTRYIVSGAGFLPNAMSRCDHRGTFRPANPGVKSRFSPGTQVEARVVPGTLHLARGESHAARPGGERETQMGAVVTRGVQRLSRLADNDFGAARIQAVQLPVSELRECADPDAHHELSPSPPSSYHGAPETAPGSGLLTATMSKCVATRSLPAIVGFGRHTTYHLDSTRGEKGISTCPFGYEKSNWAC